ncbi:MAG: hypothetical protein U9N49_06690, partial [Campylobacterota bacterium]|nr:hypothetical protein [Campylobacterota bacterium]
LKVDEIWVDKIPQKYLDLIELHKERKDAYEYDLGLAMELDLIYNQYLNENNLHESTFIKIPSSISKYGRESIAIEIYGIWYYSNGGWNITCRSGYIGHNITLNEEGARIDIKLKKYQFYGAYPCDHETPWWELELKDTININLRVGQEYQVVIENPNGEVLSTSLRAE